MLTCSLCHRSRKMSSLITRPSAESGWGASQDPLPAAAGPSQIAEV
jgi:hypothetical protein